eukprot:3940389-Rhodomonas_salina.2
MKEGRGSAGWGSDLLQFVSEVAVADEDKLGRQPSVCARPVTADQRHCFHQQSTASEQRTAEFQLQSTFLPAHASVHEQIGAMSEPDSRCRKSMVSAKGVRRCWRAVAESQRQADEVERAQERMRCRMWELVKAAEG